MEGVLDEFQSGLFGLGQDDLDHIEAEGDIGIIEHAQPGEGAARDAPLLIGVQAIHGPLLFIAAPTFHFDEDERVVMATNQVDLPAARRLEIAVKNLVAIAFEKPGGQLFSARAERVDMLS